MFLNDFRADRVFRLLSKIKEKNIQGLIINCNVNENDLKSGELVSMHYIDYFHRIDIDKFNPSQERLFINKEAICEIVPQEVFIENINPSFKIFKDFK